MPTDQVNQHVLVIITYSNALKTTITWIFFLLLPTAKKGFKLSETIYFLMLTQVMSGIIVRNYMRHAYATF